MQVIKESDKNSVELACEFLRAGKVISFATDTIYGLAVDAANSKAVETLYKIKNRDEKKPIAIFLKDLATAKKIFLFDELSQKISEKFLPGALTLVLKTKEPSLAGIASNLNKNSDGFLGFRIVDHKFTKNLLEKFGGNLAVTSANLTNQKAAVSAKEVEKYFSQSNLDLLIDGGTCEQQVASTVAKIYDKKITILRQGLINLSDYESF